MQRWPEAWLLTDERMGAAVDAAIARAVAQGAGVIVRHHQSSASERERLARLVKDLAGTLGVSRDVTLARTLDAALVHNPASETPGLPFSLSVHDEVEADAAAKQPAALVFVSPVYATRSHPSAAALGEQAALALARQSGHPAIALGGMDAAKGAALMARGFSGWAGIDCWLRT
jgi:thiamine-phosphate pyrophosphorylase